MLRSVGVVAMAAAVLVVGCGEDAPDDPAEALADRVSRILTDDGDAVLARLAEGDLTIDAAALAGADVLCPRVTDPAPGDRATCRVTVDDVELEVDVSFLEGGGLQVVQVAVAP